ncbi:hypothetical protein BCR39DRAFT_553603 [Naematelia encephala]|uniref:UNC-45/Cro1/She4 central domain-containing protein n=1 Tax=Naematelia encephala TaxID=71784 RepID=A0A1Y2AG25_9TREE|nr:hypothetical protein BCR39DRAFT_553603 [Naematelia encephala]
MSAEGRSAVGTGIRNLLRRLTGPGISVNDIQTRDVELIATSLLPSSPKHDRSIAYLCLSRICEDVHKSTSSDEEACRRIAEVISPLVKATFEGTDGTDDVSKYLPLTYLLASLFPLSPQAGILLLNQLAEDGGEDVASDTDALAVLLEVAELSSPLQPALAELLAQAAGTKVGRELVRSRAVEWLRGGLSFGGSDRKELGALCAVALSKLGASIQASENGAAEGSVLDEQDQQALCTTLVDHVLSKPAIPTVLPTIEGLSILSLRPRIKDLLAHQPTFLRTLLSYSPVPAVRGGSLPVTPRASMDLEDGTLSEMTDTSLCYGITTILVNLTARRPVLSNEDEQIAKIRAMAISGKKNPETEVPDPLEDDEHVRERVGVAIRAGVVSAMRGLVRADSLLVKSSVGRLSLNLVEDKENRPIFVRDGGFRSLATIVRDLLLPSKTKQDTGSTKPTQIDTLPALQALAKLIITTPPNLLFPPPYPTTCLNSLVPIYTLLCHPSSSLLQQFEALMALTNLASINPDTADRIVEASIVLPATTSHFIGSGRESPVRIMSKVEELMLSDNNLVRRAATELMCNLTACEKGMEYFASTNDARTRSKLNILLVLTAVDDLATRLAAAGALAMITDAPVACGSLLQGSTDIESNSGKERSTWARLLGLLEPDEDEDEEGEKIQVISSTPLLPNIDLAHRAITVLFNLVAHIVGLSADERKKILKVARSDDIENKLMAVLRLPVGQEVLAPTVEILKILKRYPASQ